jgi:hypothetical protein
MNRRWASLVLASIAAIAATPSPAGAQLMLGEVPQYELSGRAIVAYGGTWQDADGHGIASHQLSEGVSLSLSGWLYQSRLVKFRTYVLILRLDDFGASRTSSYSLGYGGSLSLMSRSILPVTFAYNQALAVTGATVQAAGVTSATSLLGIVRLVSPALPRMEVRGQRLSSDDATGNRSTTDTVTGSAYGASTLHSYSAVASWQGDQATGEPRTTTTLASISDEATLSSDTHASFNATLTRSAGLGGGGANDVFTGYSASGALLTRLSPGTLLRGGYGFSVDTAADRESTQNHAALGSTIDLRPMPLLLGEALSASETHFTAPGLDRTVEAVAASQGIGTHARWGITTGSLAATGQAGYSTVSDGVSGPIYGYGLTGGLNSAFPGVPALFSAYYNDREDHSSAGLSQRGYGALASSQVSRWYPLFLTPALSYAHVEEHSFFAEQPGGAGLAAPMSFVENDTFTATLTGASPLYRTRLTFAGGYVDATSRSASTHLRMVYGRAADVFRLGQGTFGNLALNVNHTLGGGSTVNAITALVWSFRESSLSATYNYSVSLPAGSSAQTLALLFTRSFGATFLPESQ